jgi:hypothetical protein
MSNRHEQFLSLYKASRHDDQAAFYKARFDEFEKARKQAVILSGVLMSLSVMASLLTTLNVFGPKSMWAVLSVVLPALSTAFAAYNSLYAFEQQSKLYRDAYLALHKAAAGVYGLQSAANNEADYQAGLKTYVTQVEEIFRKEQGQWGQLISEIKFVEPSSSKKSKD